MAIGDFNEESEKPEFIYRKKPDVERSYFICQFKDERHDYEPVGDYTVLDLDEEAELSETRIMTVISVLNEKRRKPDLSSLTNTRILFNIIPRKPEDTDQKIILRTHDGTGVSKENAIIVIDKDVFDES